MSHRWFRALAPLILMLPLLAACRSGTTPADREAPGITITFACQGYQYQQYEDLARTFEEQNPALEVQVVAIDA